MSGPQFTRGPWSLGPWVDSMGGHVYRVVSSPARRVSSVSVYGKRPDGSIGGRPLKNGGHTKTVASEECEANALLIAAAPELYELVEQFERVAEYELREMEREKPEDDEGIRLRSLNLALIRETLRKARGEQ